MNNFAIIGARLVAAGAFVAVASCANSNGAGSETHFLCTLDSECPAGAVCVGGRCVSSEAGTRADAATPSKGGTPDATTRSDTGASPDSPDISGLQGCAAVAPGSPMPITDQGLNVPVGTTFAWSASGALGVWPLAARTGYRVFNVAQAGEPQVTPETIWSTSASFENPSIAATRGAIAVVAQAPEGPSARQTCVLGIARYSDLVSIREPSRYSDPPDDGTILHEAADCAVTAVGNDFIVVFRQYTSSTTSEWGLFAERYGSDAKRIGDRLTIATGDALTSKVEGVSIASDGAQAVVAYSPAKGATASFIAGTAVHTVPLSLQGAPRVTSAHGVFLFTAGDQLEVLDGSRRRLAGPVPLDGAQIAPLGAAWIAVSHEEYLVARALDGTWQASSTAAGISDDRQASLRQLVSAPDGSATFVVFSDATGLKLTPLSCGSEAGPPPGPAACPTSTIVDPLDDGCTDAVCHLAIRLDYRTLGVRGYASVGRPSKPVDAAAVQTTAAATFAAHCDFCSSDVQVSSSNAGVYSAFAPPSDFGAFALVGADSGAVITAGGVAWAGRGTYYFPDTWKSASDIRCGMGYAVPSTAFMDVGGCDDGSGKGGAAANDALNLAMRTNLAKSVVQKGPFEAYVYLYTPTVGACDPSVAEYVVVLTRH